MQPLVKRLEKALKGQLGILPQTSLIKDGIYGMVFPGHRTQLFIYADFITNRLHIPASQPVIHLDQDVLQQDFEKVVARIAVIFGSGKKLHARQTVAARIDKQVAMEFQHEHHLQVALPGKYRYGLFSDGELVSIAVFSGGRKMNGRPPDYRSFELLRFCHKSGFLVVGGLSKLIKTFQKDFDPGDIMTYVDRDWSQDSALKSIGFAEISTTPPQRYILEGNKRRSITDLEYDNIQSNTVHGKAWVKSNSGSTKMILFFQGDDYKIRQ